MSTSPFEQLLERLPRFEVVPFVGGDELYELDEVSHALARLAYPINSKAHLLSQLGGPDASIQLAGATVRVSDMVSRVPASYFPVACLENFVEKAAELLSASRKAVDVEAVLSDVRRHFDNFRQVDFPIDGPDALLIAAGVERPFRFIDQEVRAEDMVRHIPAHYYPFASVEDFMQKIGYLLSNRPLIVPDVAGA